MRSLTAAAALATLAGSALAQEQTTLYWMGFGSTTTGAVVGTSTDPAPRTLPSNIRFGSPNVVASHGGLTDKPLRLSPAAGETYDQIQLALDTANPNGFSQVYGKYTLEFDVTWLGGQLSVFFDVPTIRVLRLSASGFEIDNLANGDNYVIRSLSAGVAYHVEYIADVVNDELKVYINGVQEYAGPLGASRVDEARFSQSLASSAIDNVHLFGIGKPCPGDYNGDGYKNTNDFFAFLADYQSACP